MQSGVLQEAVMVAVPAAAEVTVAVTAPEAPVTVELPDGIELHVTMGVMDTPLVSRISAVRACVPAGERVKVVFELLAS